MLRTDRKEVAINAVTRTIAVVEDEPAIRDNYLAALRRQGYRVTGYGSRAEALEAFADRLPDLVLVDIGLGAEAEGGFDLCRELRARSATLPIIFLTARDSELDTVSGLRLGADDYLTKDISLAHLTARVAALFRRLEALSRPAEQETLLERDGLQLDMDRFAARWQGKDVGLSLTEFWIVHALARHPGHVKNRQQLMDAASVVMDDASITSQLKRIRRKFQALDRDFEAIGTVYGMGYRWTEGGPGS